MNSVNDNFSNSKFEMQQKPNGFEKKLVCKTEYLRQCRRTICLGTNILLDGKNIHPFCTRTCSVLRQKSLHIDSGLQIAKIVANYHIQIERANAIPSHTFSYWMHKPLLHRNSGHSVQFSISSLLSRQSAFPSHKKLRGIHCFESLHWNLSGGHVTAVHFSGRSSLPSLQCVRPSHTTCDRKHRFPSHMNPVSPEIS